MSRFDFDQLRDRLHTLSDNESWRVRDLPAPLFSDGVLAKLDELGWIEFRAWVLEPANHKPLEDSGPYHPVPYTRHKNAGWFSPFREPHVAGSLAEMLATGRREPEVSPEVRLSEDGKRQLVKAFQDSHVKNHSPNVSASAFSARKSPVEWAGADRGSYAVVFTDIVDSTGLRSRAGDASSTAMIWEHLSRSQDWVRERGGCFVKSMGDGTLAFFRTSGEALDFALAIVRETGNPLIKLRVGIHVGEVDLFEHDIQGSTVDITRRVQEIAAVSQIMVSARAHDDIIRAGRSGHRDLPWQDEGERELKGVGSEKLWSISVASLKTSGH